MLVTFWDCPFNSRKITSKNLLIIIKGISSKKEIEALKAVNASEINKRK